MAVARSSTKLPDPHSAVALYTDISAATGQKRREFAQVTVILREKNITYKWGFRPKLVVTFQNQTTNIFMPKEGIKWLLNWGLISTPPPNPDPRQSQACSRSNFDRTASL